MFEVQYHKKDLKGKSFLITGGAGFIGSNLAEYLLKFGAGKVRVLDDLSTGYFKNIESFLANPNFEFINGDIRSLETCQKACAGINIVFHQAALGSVPRSINDPISTNSVNVDGFLNMLVAARDQKTDRFIYAASSSTYGDSLKLPKIESEIGSPLSPYAVTKYVNELYASVFALSYGMKTIGLRYFNVFGPRQSPKGEYAAVIPLFIQGLIDNKSITIDGDGTQTRDFTFVENAIQANIRAAFVEDEAALNTIYNVAVGERTSIIGMYEILRAASGTGLNPEFRPARRGDIKDSLADISKIKNLLGYEPSYKLKQGLELTLEWFKNNKQFIEKD